MVRFEISDFFAPAKILYWHEKLKKTPYFSEKERRRLEWHLLSKVLDHCFENVPFYKTCYKRRNIKRTDIQSLADLQKLPVIHKRDVFQFHDQFKAARFKRYNPKKLHTSGTTGSPLIIYWDQQSNIMELLCQWRHFSWFGYHLGDPFLDIGNFKGHLNKPVEWNWQCRGLLTSIRFWNENNIREFAYTLSKYKIKFWRGNPSALYELCECFSKANIQDVKPDFIITIGETLLPFQKEFIEKWANCPVRINYGLLEHTALICQCPEEQNHIAWEYGIVEIVKDDGTPAKPGEEGRVVSTGLHNKAFPLLRYDTGDFAVRSEKACPCGRTMPILKNMTGRLYDHVLDANQKRIFGLHYAFKNVNGIRYSQIVQDIPGILKVYIIPTPDYNQTAQEQLLKNLFVETGDSMKINILVVESLPYPSERKFKFVVNNVK